MPKKMKPKRKAAKPGRKELRLVIPDAQAALDRLLRKKPAR